MEKERQDYGGSEGNQKSVAAVIYFKRNWSKAWMECKAVFLDFFKPIRAQEGLTGSAESLYSPCIPPAPKLINWKWLLEKMQI